MKKATESTILWPSISLGITKTDQHTRRITLGDVYCNEILPVLDFAFHWVNSPLGRDCSAEKPDPAYASIRHQELLQDR
jgi:hypothetical protein